MKQEKPSDQPEPKDTDYRIHIGGNVSTEGDFVGRDKITYVGLTLEQVSDLIVQLKDKSKLKQWDGRVPYVGLSTFQETDASFFFGREVLVENLVARLKGAGFLCVAGPSGSGKSSIIRAGLIPSLKHLFNSNNWLFQSLEPHNNPIEQLALSLSRVGKSPPIAKYIRDNAESDINTLHDTIESLLSDQPNQRFVLFIDQFEELFTQTRERERSIFLDLLTTSVAKQNSRLIVIMAIRSDFVSNCASYSQLTDLMNERFQLVGAMQPSELVNAIYKPASQVGIDVEPELIRQIIDDMQGEPGALPLMQFALKDLFDSQKESNLLSTLTRQSYLDRGGIHKSLERHADAAFRKLSKDEKKLAEAIFSGLIQIGRGDAETRRTATFEELVPAGIDIERIEVVVNTLSTARLIITDREVKVRTVTLAHEKLIEAWPWLHKLVDENRESILLVNQLNEAAKDWENQQKDESYLYTGARLVGVKERIAQKQISLSNSAEAFLQNSIQAYEATLRENEERRQRELTAARRRTIAFAVIGVVASAVAVVVYMLYRDANHQRQLTLARQLAAQAIAYSSDQLDLAILLGIAANRIDDSFETRRSLLTTIQKSPRLTTFLREHKNSVDSVAFSVDGRLLATAGGDNVINLWNPFTQQLIGEPLSAHTKTVRSIEFSPDNRLLVSGGDDGQIIFWDLMHHRKLSSVNANFMTGVHHLVIDPLGRMVAAIGCNKLRPNSDTCISSEIRFWSLSTFETIEQSIAAHQSDAWALSFSPDGKLLASGGDDRKIFLWNTETWQQYEEPLLGHSDWVRNLTFSPDMEEMKLVSGGYDGVFVIWDPITGEALDTGETEDRSPVLSSAFDSNGMMLAIGGRGKTITLWYVNSVYSGVELLEETDTLIGHSAGVSDLSYSPDGLWLASASEDSTAILWSIEGDRPLSRSIGSPSSKVWTFDLAPKGNIVAAGYCNDFVTLETGGCTNGEIRFVDIATSNIITTLQGNIGSRDSVVFSPNDEWLAISGCGKLDKRAAICNEGEVRLWNLKDGLLEGSPVVMNSHKNWITGIAFSSDSKYMATSSSDLTIRLWDIASGEVIGDPFERHQGTVWSLVFNRDNTLLISGSADKSIIIWDVATHRPIYTPLQGHTSDVWSLALSTDGKTLASGGQDNTILMWDITTGVRLGRQLTGHKRAVNSIAFSSDGSLLASSGGDSSIILWDVKRQERLGAAFEGQLYGVTKVEFLPDGAKLVAGALDGTIRNWVVRVDDWAKLGCTIANRKLTDVEMLHFIGAEVTVC